MFRLAALVFAGGVLLGGPLPSDTLLGAPQLGAQEFEPLFNGRDLEGWTVHGTERWYVEHGELVCESGPDAAYGYLRTNETYRDFELVLEFKQEADGNSGVFFRSSLDGVVISGWQAEVAPPGLYSGGIYESYGRGWLVQPAPEKDRALRMGEWNEMRLRVVGPRVTTWINGTQMVDFVDDRIGEATGHIALQIHDGGGIKVRWRNLRVREMGGSTGLEREMMEYLRARIEVAEDKFLQLAEAVPEDRYDWRPMEGVRSFREVFIHIAADNWAPLAMDVPLPDDIPVTGDMATFAAYQDQRLTKAETLDELRRSFDFITSSMDPTLDRLDATVTFGGREWVTYQMWTALVTHMHEHLGQVIAYARTNEIVPPWSR